MTLLQREAIRDRLEHPDNSSRLFITPLLDNEQVNHASIDLRLGSEFIETRRRAEDAIDPYGGEGFLAADSQERYEVPFGERMVLHPGQFLLGSTFEFLRLPLDLGGQVLGRSSWGRFGLIVATAVTVQPGFAGSLTLELQNLGSVPIHLYPGLRIAQLMLWSTQAPVDGEITVSEPPLGPVSRKVGWTAKELERLKVVQTGLSG